MKFRSLASRIGSLVAVTLCIAAPQSARAQCGPDGLDLGACCQPVFPTLPGFAGVQLPGLGINWNNCNPVQQANLKIDVGTPTQTVCGQYSAGLNVFDVNTGILLLSGKLVLDYTRTWKEVDTAGTSFQVWRFAAKVDLHVATLGIAPLPPIPNCIVPFGPHPTAFFYGYMDWADGCTGLVPRNALVLYHANDFFIHNPLLSDKPGAFHPTRGFAIVAPHNTAQFFVPATQLAQSGPLLAEATRDVVNLLPSFCVVEDRILSGSIQTLGGACLCNFFPVPQQHSFRIFTGKTACPDPTGVGGNFQSLALNFPTLPWFHMTSTSIGFWSNPNVYPGNESAWVDEGLFLRNQACQGQFVSINYGGSTQGGMPAFLPTLPAAVSGFTDIADNYTAPTGGPFPFPVLGSVRPTDQLIYVNVP